MKNEHKLKFNAAYLRLTAFYVLIVLAISISFSVVIFNISSNELNRGLVRQDRFIMGMSSQMIPNSNLQDLEQIRSDQIAESNSRLSLNLLYFNLFILVASSFLSYYLARKTLAPVEEAVAEQNRFTADASHELRTPLAALRSEIEVGLRDKKLDLKSSKQLLESNLEEIGKLESLSNALLKLSRYSDDKDMELEKVELEETIVRAYEKVEHAAIAKNIEFKNKISECMVYGQHDQLVELFVILFDNAIKYSPENSKVSVTSEYQGKELVVSVRDRGVGIKASDLPFIFNRFYRADSSRSKDKIPGYGLGLSIAKRICEINHCEISAESKAGQGSEFIVKFSLNQNKNLIGSRQV